MFQTDLKFLLEYLSQDVILHNLLYEIQRHFLHPDYNNFSPDKILKVDDETSNFFLKGWFQRVESNLTQDIFYVNSKNLLFSLEQIQKKFREIIKELRPFINRTDTIFGKELKEDNVISALNIKDAIKPKTNKAI